VNAAQTFSSISSVSSPLDHKSTSASQKEDHDQVRLDHDLLSDGLSLVGFEVAFFLYHCLYRYFARALYLLLGFSHPLVFLLVVLLSL